VVAVLETYDADLTVYAVEPWTCDAVAVVAREPGQGGVPAEAAAVSARYFIEVFIAREFLEGWCDAAGRATTARERCERLITYAVTDA
jgi:hypothetical protein